MHLNFHSYEWKFRRCAAEVLGRHSNRANLAATLRSVAEAAVANVRQEPWRSPELMGTLRVRRVLATELDAMIADYDSGMGCVVLSRKYGLAENTVMARMREAGLEIRHHQVVDVGPRVDAE